MAKFIIVSTGATMFLRAVNGQMEIAVKTKDLVQQLAIDAEINIKEIECRSGAELTFDTILKIRDVILEARDSHDGVIVLTGTDSMEEMAFSLDLMLSPGVPVVVTGSMRPADAVGYDGYSNLADAIAVAGSRNSRRLGVLVVMNESVHPARYIRKQDSQLPGAFQSHPGPIAQMRLGPHFYYAGLPKMKRFLTLDDDKLRQLNVLLWPVTAQPTRVPVSLLKTLDGMVIAGMGTGSVPQKTVEELQPWVNRIPIVISSRCPIGMSYDDQFYQGSREKYENQGFRILGYEYLNPYQARIQLMLEQASA